MSFTQCQVPYQNQLQFNLAVPLTSKNLAMQHQHPRPIFVERISGQHAIPGNVSSRKPSQEDSGHNYSVLSEDKMEMMSQLARRDLKNRKLQAEQNKQNSAQVNVHPTSSPVRAQMYKKSCSRVNRENGRLKQPLRAREADKNRRLGAVQTPPPRKPPPRTKFADDSFIPSRNASPDVSRNADVYFPVKPFVPEGKEPAKEEIERLQQEMEGYLRLIENIEERAIAEGNTKFLHPSAKGKSKDGFLDQIEDLGRARARVTEQNTRSARNTYNIRQKVKQLQRDLAHADLSKPIKKAQIMIQLTSVYRGAVKSLLTFVNQLPHQDLSSGLPSHYTELALLIRQLIALDSLTHQEKQPPGENVLLTLLDSIDALNAKWCAAQPGNDNFFPVKKEVKTAQRPWVNDTKVDKEFGQPKTRQQSAMKKTAPTKQVASRGRPKNRASGKENRGVNANERKAMLQAGIASLVGKNGSSERPNIGQSGMAWEVDMRAHHNVPEHAKGYLLPSDLQMKRERAQKAVEVSNQRRKFEETRQRAPHYAEPTASATLKASPGRPASASSSPKRKEVNFDMNPVPWIPAGSGSRSRKSRSRSLSPDRHQYNPFYVRNLDREDVRNVFPGSQSLKTVGKMTEQASEYGFRSLPSREKLRSHQVSDSLLDDLEDRLYDRLRESRGLKSFSSPQNRVYERDDSTIDVTTDAEFEDSGDLDITDLTDPGEGVRREAVAIMDAPTLENIKLRLAEMQREQRDIRQRWSSVKFADTQPTSRTLSKSTHRVSQPQTPPAIEVTKFTQSEKSTIQGPVNKDWVEEPLLFTKPSSISHVQFHHTVKAPTESELETRRTFTLAGGRPAKKLLTMKQTAVERIKNDRERYQNYLKKHSHHPSGKFDPWQLMEEISDEIFSECLQDVAGEVEQINEEIANQMYKSEFTVDKNQAESPEPVQSYFPPKKATKTTFSPLPETHHDGIIRERAEKRGPLEMERISNKEAEIISQKEAELQKILADSVDRMVGGGDTAALTFDTKSVGSRESSPERNVSPERRSLNVSPERRSLNVSPERRSLNVSPDRRSLGSVGYSPVYSPAQNNSGGKPSPNLSAQEPELEDVGMFVGQHDDSGSIQEGRLSRQEHIDNEEEYSDDKYDDEDDDEYSDEDFEDVSDV